MYKIHNPKLIYEVNRTYVKKERRKKRSVSKWSDMQSRVNQYCRIREHRT